MSAFDPANDYWSAGEDATLSLLWDAGEPLNAISKVLGKRSRNAVACRARRLHLSHRTSPIPYKSPDRDRQTAAGFLAAREAIAAEARIVSASDYLTNAALKDEAIEREVKIARLRSGR